MKLYSNNINHGYFDDAMGKRGGQFVQDKKPSRSFHLAWEDVPPGTVSLAIIMTDEDAIPVCGFSWIHWTVANIDPSLKSLPENASCDMTLLEGVTSWSSGIVSTDWRLRPEDDIGFGGCAPPHKDHCYTIDVYALDNTVNLKRGFYKNELVWAMQGHILDQATLYAVYKK